MPCPELMIQRQSDSLRFGDAVTSCWLDPELILCWADERKCVPPFSMLVSLIAEPHVTKSSSSSNASTIGTNKLPNMEHSKTPIGDNIDFIFKLFEVVG